MIAGLRSIMPAAGTFVTCAVSVELMLPLTGKKKELGVNLHATAVGALHASWNWPVAPLVPIMVTAKLAVPPTGIVTAPATLGRPPCPRSPGYSPLAPQREWLP